MTFLSTASAAFSRKATSACTPATFNSSPSLRQPGGQRHELSWPLERTKGGSDERIAQSRRILAFLASGRSRSSCAATSIFSRARGAYGCLEEEGLRNLIAEHAVTSTRTSLYPRAERFADYVFVSAGVDVLEFGALPDEVSDHAPLSLGFALS
jgi:hypothetical protein